MPYGYGTGSYGVGGAIAGGIQSGFEMGRQMDADNERRSQRDFENRRQTEIDKERVDQIQRTNTRQDTDDALNAVNGQIADHAVTGAGLAHDYGGWEKVPADQQKAYAATANTLAASRSGILRQKLKPVVEREQQWARDISSKVATGQMSMDDLSPADTVRWLQAGTSHPVGDLLRPANGGNSKIGQGVADATAGVQTNNSALTAQGANTLLAPQVGRGVGQTIEDGSVITAKKLVGFAPAPTDVLGQPAMMQAPPPSVNGAIDALNNLTGAAQPQGVPPQSPDPSRPLGTPPAPAQQGQPQGQPQGMPPQQSPTQALMAGADPDKVLPVLQITTQHPDGTEQTYHAPVTVGRGTEADAQIAPPISVKDAMDHMGQLGTLEAWANTPAARAKIEQGLKDLGAQSNGFLGAYYAMHGDANALLTPEERSVTGQRIAAIKKLAKSENITFEEAARALAGRARSPLQAKLDTIDEDESLSDAEKADARRVAVGITKVGKSGLVGATGGGMGGGAPGTASPAKGATSMALGGVAAPGDAKSKGEAYQKVVDFWATAVVAGDKDWQVGLARGGKEAVGLIKDVKMRVPGLAAELGLTPQDIGTARAQSAALGATLKDLTKRQSAVDLFASKVEKDMTTFESVLDKASPGGPLFINKPINILRRQFSSEDLSQLDLAAKQVGTEYERLLQGGALSVAQLHTGAAEDAKKLINGDMSPTQARAIMRIMKTEMGNARSAAAESTARLQNQMRGLGKGPLGSATQPSAAPPSAAGNGTGLGGGAAAAPAAAPQVQTATGPGGKKLYLVNGQWSPTPPQ
jgi:hypothetical protein